MEKLITHLRMQILPTTLRINSRVLDAIKVRDDDGSVFVFITTDSIQREFALSLESRGSLLNTDVVDIQALFDAVEAQAEFQALYSSMESTLEFEVSKLPIGTKVRIYDGKSFVTLDEANKYVCTDIPNLLKVICFTLDETPLISLHHFNQLLARRALPHVSKQLRKARTKYRKHFSQL